MCFTDKLRVATYCAETALRDRRGLQRLGVAAATCIALTSFVPSARADVLYNTDGAGTIWGTQTVPPGDPNFPGPTYHDYSYGGTTIGETFTAPSGANVLKSISFDVAADTAFTLKYTAYTFAFSGSQSLGGNPIGAALWTSGPQSIALHTLNTSSWNGYQLLTLNENLTLTPGQQYMTLIVTSNDGTDGNSKNGNKSHYNALWGTFVPTASPNPNDPNTLYNWSYINDSNLNDLTTLNWNACGAACNFSGAIDVAQGAFEADFASAVPEPSTWAMMMLGFAGLGFLSYRRTRRNGGLKLRLA